MMHVNQSLSRLNALSAIDTNVSVCMLTKGPRDRTVVRNDVIEASNSTKMVSIRLGRWHMRLEMIGATIVSDWCDRIESISNMTESNMRMWNTTARAY